MKEEKQATQSHSIYGKASQFVYGKDDQLIYHPARKNMDAFILQIVVGTIFGTIVGVVYITGFLRTLGASDQMLNYVALLPSIPGAFTVLWASKLQGMKTRRKPVVIFNLFNKTILSSIVFVALFFSKNTTIYIVFIMLVIGYLLNSLMNILVNTWIVETVSLNIRGRYFSVRQAFGVAVSIFFPTLVGFLMDRFQNPFHGFLLFFSVACLLGLLESYTFSRVKDPEQTEETKAAPAPKFKLKDTFTIPLKNKSFRIFVIQIIFFQLALQTSASFNQTYMQRYLEIPYFYINILTVITALTQVFVFYKFWGRTNDALNANFILQIAFCNYAIESLVWFFVRPNTAFAILPIVYLINSFGAAAFTLGVFARKSENIPKEHLILYDAFYAAVIGIMFIITPFLGQQVRNFLTNNIQDSSQNFISIRLPYLITAALLLVMQSFYMIVTRKKEGEDFKYLHKKDSYMTMITILKDMFVKG